MDLVKTYPCCHNDDFHSLGWQTEREIFYSGSKDGSVKLWQLTAADEIELYQTVSKAQKDYTKWITAMTPLNPNGLLFGSRDGILSKVSWETEDSAMSHLPLSLERPSVQQPNCKRSNMERITTVCSLSAFDQGESPLSDLALVGRPKELLCVTTNEENLRIQWNQSLHSNDWVYCILPILKRSPDLLHACIVTGSSIALYDINLAEPSETITNRARKIQQIWQEDRCKVAKGANRAHIAHLEQLQMTDPGLISGSCFDGKIRIFDLHRGCLARELAGHQGRCWQSVEIRPRCFASGADDGVVKIWDLRTREGSVFTSGKHKGRVSCLLKTSKDQVITASCAEDPHRDPDKGYLTLFDLRHPTVSVSNPLDLTSSS